MLGIVGRGLFMGGSGVRSRGCCHEVSFLGGCSLLFRTVVTVTVMFVIRVVSHEDFVSTYGFMSTRALTFVCGSFLIFMSFSLICLFEHETFTEMVVANF